MGVTKTAKYHGMGRGSLRSFQRLGVLDLYGEAGMAPFL
jgi:hypothetical protein